MTDPAKVAEVAADRKQCHDCAHFQRGYRVYGSRVPSSCNRHFHTIHGDDPACDQFREKGDSDV